MHRSIMNGAGYILFALLFVQCTASNVVFSGANFLEANFEDTRCRCICPSTEFFRTHNNTPDENYRRYYTKTNVNSLTCFCHADVGPWGCRCAKITLYIFSNTQTVVKQAVKKIVDENRLDAFLANCNCKFESRNSVLLKDVVLFVICVIMALGGYMTYLVVVDPVLRRPTQFIPYRRQDDDVGFSNTFWFGLKGSDSDSETLEDNIFAQPTTGSTDSNRFGESSVDGMQMLARTAHGTHNVASNVLGKVEAEQNKWMNSVEEQRRKVMMDHTMLN